MGSGSIPVVADGCGLGGTVAWTYTWAVSPGVAVLGMAAGPMGEVALGTYTSGSNACSASGLVLDASGAGLANFSSPGAIGSCSASATPLGFDPQGHVLSGYEAQSGSAFGTAHSGFVGESVSTDVFGSNAMGPIVYAGFMGADAAGNLYVVASVTPPFTIYNFGLDPVSGTVALHYNPSGTLVSDTLRAPNAVGALGGLFTTTQVNGTLDDGCGTVGTAGTSSTVITKRDASGTCLWSKALPPSVGFALDPLENVLLVTTFSGTIDFGGGPLTSAGTSDLAIAKLDAAGTYLWSKRFGAAGASVSNISAFSATSDGGVALSATLGAPVDFGCGTIGPSGGATTLFARFDAMGAVVYSRVVQLLQSSFGTQGPVADGLGGFEYAARVKYQPTNCTCSFAFSLCAPNDPCDYNQGLCLSCEHPQPGNVLISRFAP